MTVDQAISLAVKHAVPIVFALVVIYVGFKIAKKIAAVVETNLNKAPNSDASLSRFFASLIKYLLMVAVLMVGLGILDVDTTPIVGLLIASGAAIGFILQGSLSNVAAGVMLMLFRPFNVGDEIEAGGTSGVVTGIELTATRLKTADNVEIIVANGDIWGGTIKNRTSMGARRLDMDFGVGYEADIDKALTAITGAAAANPRVHSDPAPWAKVVNLGDSSVDIQLRVWCDAGDYKTLSTEISQPVKQALDAAGISIPYPHEVKIKQTVKTSKGRDRNARLKTLREQNS